MVNGWAGHSREGVVNVWEGHSWVGVINGRASFRKCVKGGGGGGGEFTHEKCVGGKSKTLGRVYKTIYKW